LANKLGYFGRDVDAPVRDVVIPMQNFDYRDVIRVVNGDVKPPAAVERLHGYFVSVFGAFTLGFFWLVLAFLIL
jgi:hypothetical protein